MILYDILFCIIYLFVPMIFLDDLFDFIFSFNLFLDLFYISLCFIFIFSLKSGDVSGF